MDFKEWLIKEKNYTERSASDVVSRNQRVKKILNIKEITSYTEKKLENEEDFRKLSCSVKSQLRISIRTLLEYKGAIEEND